MKIESMKFLDAVESEQHEGIVLLGAGGDQQKWITGVTQLLKDEGVAQSNFKFSRAINLTTTGGRNDLFLVFESGIDVGKLVMWRLRFGDCSWWSDYKVNYAEHHGVILETDEDDYDEEEW